MNCYLFLEFHIITCKRASLAGTLIVTSRSWTRSNEAFCRPCSSIGLHKFYVAHAAPSNLGPSHHEKSPLYPARPPLPSTPPFFLPPLYNPPLATILYT